MKILETQTEQETFALGERFAKAAFPGMILTLDGDLGCGKTVFTKGLAFGLGITEPVTSPTFTILSVYDEGRLPLYHFDVYRIGDIEEMYEIGYEEYFFGEGITVVEWSELVEELIPPSAVRIWIEKDLEKGFDYRRVTILNDDGFSETVKAV